MCQSAVRESFSQHAPRQALRGGKRATGEPSFGTDKRTPQDQGPHRMQHYWLCDEYFPLVTLTFTKGLGLVMVPLLRSQAGTAEAKKPVNSLRRSELLPQQPAG